MEAPNNGVSFLNTNQDDQEPNVALATDGEQKNSNHRGKNFDKAKVTCHRCGKKGHYPPDCDQDQQQQQRQTGEQMLTAGMANGEFDDTAHVSFQFHQSSKAEITLKTSDNGQVPNSWILLDNQSTVNVFHNGDLLDNIRQANGFMDIHCNAAVTSTNLVGDLPGYGEVWYNPNGIANILSLSRDEKQGFRVTFNSSHGNEFHVHKPNGTKRSRIADCTTWTQGSPESHY
jgi:hypothetical protein